MLKSLTIAAGALAVCATAALADVATNKDIVRNMVEEVFVLHGVALYLSGEKKMAGKAFERAVIYHPTAKHDLSKWGAKVQAAFDAARDKVLLRKPVTWEVRTEPPNAEVWVNGRYYGISPTFVRSYAGQQFVRLYKQGYARLEKGHSGQPERVYVAPAANWSKYDSVLRDPVGIWRSDVSRDQGISHTEAQLLANYFYTLLDRDFSQVWRVTRDPQQYAKGFVPAKLRNTDER